MRHFEKVLIAAILVSCFALYLTWPKPAPSGYLAKFTTYTADGWVYDDGYARCTWKKGGPVICVVGPTNGIDGKVRKEYIGLAGTAYYWRQAAT